MKISRVARIRLDLSSQPVHVLLHQVWLADPVRSPDSGQDGVGAEHLAGVADQQPEYLKLLGGQIHGLVLDHQFVAITVQHDRGRGEKEITLIFGALTCPAFSFEIL